MTIPGDTITTDHEVGTGSQRLIMRDLIEWSEGRPLWQRDALRRLMTADELTEDDFDQILALCLSEHALVHRRDSDLQAVPAEEKHIPSDGFTGHSVALQAIKSVQNVNALSTDQTLKFRHDGLTIVFGQNGSGKSGYARILKKACHARDQREAILPNVYEDEPAEPASATIDFKIDGRSSSLDWMDGSPQDSPLGRVSFFDSKCAHVHVSATNAVEFIPWPLQVLASLAALCRRLRELLQEQRSAVESEAPAALLQPKCRPETAVGRLLAGLNHETDPDRVDRLSTLSETELQQLESLKEDLANDPLRRADQIRLTNARLVQAIALVQTLSNVTNNEATTRFKDFLSDAAHKREAAEVAAADLFREAPLPNVGSETWRRLWEAARWYSTSYAYPGVDFPRVEDGARCVLCQQELSEQAANRLRAFEYFVQDSTQKAADDAERLVREQRTQIEQARKDAARARDYVATIEQEIGEHHLATSLRHFVVEARRVLRRMLRTQSSSVWPLEIIQATSPLEALTSASERLKDRIRALSEDGHSAERQNLVMTLNELEDRQWLWTVAQDVKDEIVRRKKLAALDICLASVRPDAITRKNTQVAETLVMDALRDGFADELKRMKIEHLAVECVRETGQYGTARFRIRLAENPDAPLGNVLSEGEHRCIGLAAFLAELTTADGQSALVFDDPVSSLDHVYRAAVARRLVEETEHRQVVVFTHDLWFVFELSRAAKRAGIEPHYQHVCRAGNRVGLCDSDPPIDSRPIEDAIRHLKRRFGEIRALFDEGKLGPWQEQAEGLLGRIRKAWERAVERAIAPVFSRFDYDVDTKHLRLLTVLTEDDCRAVDEHRASCSKLQHTEPASTGSPTLTPDLVEAEIDALDKWLGEVLVRQERLRS